MSKAEKSIKEAQALVRRSRTSALAAEIADELEATTETPKANVSSWSMALLAFSCVAGGPFGIEVAVGAAGAFATIIGLIVAGSLWGLPTALITAELAAAIPANGGPVVWVRRGLGKRWAFVNAILLVVQQATDIVLYPTLLASYVQQLAPNLNSGDIYGIKIASLLITSALNVIGVEALSASAAVLTGLIMLPFVLLPMVAAGKHMSFDWTAVGPQGVPAGVETQLALFCSTVLWNMQGWSELGALAGEVQNAEVVFPRGMFIAAILVVMAYASPVLFGVALQPNLSLWADGFLADLAQDVAPWLSILVLISASLANLSTFITSMAAYSRTMQAVAREGFIPVPILARNMSKWRTPIPCIALLAVSTAALMYNLDFTQLVIVDSTFFMVAQISAILSWIRMRHTEPDLPRPYWFPGGPMTAHAIAVITIAIAMFSMYTVCSGDAWWAGAATAGIVAGLFGVSLFMEKIGLGTPLDGADDEGGDEEYGRAGSDADNRPSFISTTSKTSDTKPLLSPNTMKGVHEARLVGLVVGAGGADKMDYSGATPAATGTTTPVPGLTSYQNTGGSFAAAVTVAVGLSGAPPGMRSSYGSTGNMQAKLLGSHAGRYGSMTESVGGTPRPSNYDEVGLPS